jgi:NACalpha-BTF3-like transcription factor
MCNATVVSVDKTQLGRVKVLSDDGKTMYWQAENILPLYDIGDFVEVKDFENDIWKPGEVLILTGTRAGPKVKNFKWPNPFTWKFVRRSKGAPSTPCQAVAPLSVVPAPTKVAAPPVVSAQPATPVVSAPPVVSSSPVVQAPPAVQASPTPVSPRAAASQMTPTLASTITTAAPSSSVNEIEIELVMNFTSCTRAQAVEALEKYGDVVEAIWKWTRRN